MNDPKQRRQPPSPPLLRRGTDEPLPERRLLRAGPVTAVLENGDLRYLRLGGEEIVRRVYGAVRDEHWGTLAPRFTRYEVAAEGRAFSVRFTAEHVQGEIDFVWDGTFVGTAEGVVTCTFDGEARRPFRRNRIGWCLLHPMAVAGVPANAETPDGEVEGAFPEPIAPHQPFFDLIALRHLTRGGGEVEIRFEGDLFEMEDQRNWTDASFKTYSTPLRLPYPVAVAAGERVRQTVTIRTRPGATLGEAPAGAPRPSIEVGSEPLGPLPPIGFGAASRDGALPERERELLAELRPAHSRVVLELDGEDWAGRLEAAAADAGAIGAALEIEAVTDEAGSGLAQLCRRLAGAATPVARLLVFGRAGAVTTEAIAGRARRAADEAGLAVPLGGGSRAYFTQLNRAELPLHLLDVVAYAINPQVHAFDDASLIETLEAQGVTVESARAIARGRPLAVGPVTLRPRFNPDATGPEPKPAPGELPPSVDPRQSSLFAAGWTVGSLRSLASAGVAVLTYYETTGWRGLIERSDHPLRVSAFHSAPGWAFPVYHVFADLAEMPGADLLPVQTNEPLAVAGLALRSGDALRVLVASFLDQETTVRLAVPALTGGTIRLLDESSYLQAAESPREFRRRAPALLDLARGEAEVNLPPFAVATIDGRLAASGPTSG